MKALSVKPCWAGLIGAGLKTLEIRSRVTHYRGPLLICTSKRPAYGSIPCGVAYCTVRVVGCRPMTPADTRLAGCDYLPGHFAWELADAVLVDPFPVRGQLNFFTVAVPGEAEPSPAAPLPARRRRRPA